MCRLCAALVGPDWQLPPAHILFACTLPLTLCPVGSVQLRCHQRRCSLPGLDQKYYVSKSCDNKLDWSSLGSISDQMLWTFTAANKAAKKNRRDCKLVSLHQLLLQSCLTFIQCIYMDVLCQHTLLWYCEPFKYKYKLCDQKTQGVMSQKQV